MAGKKGKMIEAKIRKEKELIDSLNPLVKEWFFSKFKQFSMPQQYGVMPIYERKSILISAPTGGTKTLTAFLSILNYLVTLAEKQELEDKIYAVYTSPLKALSGDIHVNLVKPLKEIQDIAKKRKIELQKIRVSLRTGDTPSSERQKMLKNPPHILITTPETLAIVINSVKFVEKMKNIEYLIVDEIHALANKRGVHLSLSLERIEEMATIPITRIGLSATVAPLDEIARFLTGDRDCLIANVKFSKKIDIKLISPVKDLIETTGKEIHSSLYNLIDKLIQEHKTTLIFTNTRAATERVIHHLKEIFPKNYSENPHKSEISGSSKTENFRGIGAHHSSLSKDYRFNIEERLRKGELKVVVTSTSLELGIDIGYIDLVILLGSPKSTARAVQRLGRSGHKLHEVAKGRLVVLDRDDLIECSVMKKDIIERKIDRVQIPKNALDVLSQQIYGMAIYKVWDIKEMFNLIKSSYCYSDLRYDEFLDVISYLSGEYALEHRHVYAKIWYDEEEGKIGKRGKLARVIYMTNIGTIPEESFASVVLASDRKTKVGVIDEGFLEKLRKGDIFVLGGEKYQFLYTRGMKVYVRGSVQRPPTIPSWFSEMLPLSFDLANEIGRFRNLIEEKLKLGKNKKQLLKFIQEWCYVDENISEKIYDYMYLQYKYIGIPSNKKIIIETYKADKNYFIFHTLFGRRVNDALSRGIGYLLGQLKGRDVEVGISDNGFFLVGEKIDENKINKVLKFLVDENLEDILNEAIDKTELLKRRFRHAAGRSLMILRNYKGLKKSAGKQQLRSHFLLAAVNKIGKNFPILREAKREILEDAMDIENAKLVLSWIKEKKLKIEHKKTKVPSPFATNLIIQGRADLIKMENKIEFLKRMHKEVQKQVR